MRNGLAGLGANTPATPYRVKLGSGVRFDDEDMKGTVTVNGTTYEDALMGLLGGTSGRYVDLDLTGISDAVTEIPAGQNQRSLGGYVEPNDYLVAIALPPWVTAIGAHAFIRLTKLEYINLEDTAVTEIEGLAETGIRAVTFPETLRSFAYAFGSNPHLRSVDMSAAEEITTIPMLGFKGCGALREIVWPPAVKTIDNDAFYGAAFVTLTIPSTVKAIGPSAFYHNANLIWFKWADAPSGAGFGQKFISECGRLVRIQFPPTLGFHGNSSIDFEGLGGLETVILPYAASSSLDVVHLHNWETSFRGAPKAQVYVPDECVDYYRGNAMWKYVSGIAGIITPLSALTDVPENWTVP
jgi:hypothetical protein